jgi:hypothetical protein
MRFQFQFQFGWIPVLAACTVFCGSGIEGAGVVNAEIYSVDSLVLEDEVQDLLHI